MQPTKARDDGTTGGTTGGDNNPDAGNPNAAEIAAKMARDRARGGLNSADAILTADQDKAYHTFLLGKPDATQIRAYLTNLGVNAGPGDNAEEVAKYYREGNTGYGGVGPQTLTPEQNAAVEESLKSGAGSYPAAMGAARALSSGWLDEAGAGVDAFGDAMLGRASFADALNSNLAINREVIRRSGEESPIATGAGMLLGGVAMPYGAGARTPLEVAKVGGIMSGLYGLGEGTTMGGRAAGGAIGAGLGFAGGYGLAKATPVVGNALAGVYDRVANRPSAVAARNARAGLQAEGAALQQAGQAEGVNVNRAMVDPSLQNNVTRSGMSVFGAGTVNRSMADVASGVQAGTQRLGAGGTALEPQVAGQTIQTAAERYIKQSGAVAKRQYDKAERLAGNTKVTPLEAGQRVGQLITKLSETPEINAGEIAFLQKLESDFGQDLTVGGLRRIRTQLRGKIAKGELTFGEEEANVLGIMDAASNDIANGLAAAGKTDAANAFKAADGAYRQRMSFINDTVQKLIGKRNANVTPESTLSKFQAMATPKGDEAGLGKMMAQMAPDEAADIRATLASTLGQNNKGEFSTALLASQAQKMTRAAKVHIFGQDGADSLDRLVMLAKAHNRVTSTLRGSPTGVATAANAWRTALTTVMGLGGGGAMGSMEGLATAGATAGLIGAGDVLSARALMSTNLTKWLARTPTTSADIAKHITQLSVVASREPAIANEVLQLQARLADSFGSSATRLAADEGNGRGNVVDGRKGNGQNNGGTDQGSSRQAPPNTGAPR
jgi:hypothetical protein